MLHQYARRWTYHITRSQSQHFFCLNPEKKNCKFLIRFLPSHYRTDTVVDKWKGTHKKICKKNLWRKFTQPKRTRTSFQIFTVIVFKYKMKTVTILYSLVLKIKWLSKYFDRFFFLSNIFKFKFFGKSFFFRSQSIPDVHLYGMKLVR